MPIIHQNELQLMAPSNLSASQHTQIQDKLLAWFSKNARLLPWRHSYDPYHVWLSEVMLQQTQMDRVIHYFNTWVNRFPSLESVAKADENELLKLWEGLGYYSRVRNFQKAAQRVCCNGGTVPSSFTDLITLPGIGKYTAGAILSIAFQKNYPVVDGNVERVFARMFAIETPIKSSEGQKRVWALAEALLPEGKSRQWNQALMELGALVCKKSKPDCQLCPLGKQCQAHLSGTTSLHPVAGKSMTTIAISFVAAVIVHQKMIYIQKRLADATWGNLWEFPGGHLEINETPDQGALR
nr:A/G-specific adenine glycosylase [Desulfobulbaceae bacterium]